MLARALNVQLPERLTSEAESRAARYGGAALRASETARDKARQERLAEYRAQFITGPVLVVPGGGITFDPHTLVPLDDLGTVYPRLRVSGPWGILDVSGGALLAADWKTVRVAAPQDTARPLSGPGWTLTLNDGWRVVPGPRPGDYRVAEAQ